MISHEKHIQTILSIIMHDNDRKYYVGKDTIKNFYSFMDTLENVLRWYSLPLRAEDIVVYVSDATYDDYISSSSSNEDEVINFGYGF